MKMPPPDSSQTRRQLLKAGVSLAATVLSGSLGSGAAIPTLHGAEAAMTGLADPDDHGLRLAAGLTVRVVARSGQYPVGTSGYRWHDAPDGGAVFPAPDGGWVYVSNAEGRQGKGGAGALRFDAQGRIQAAYPILAGTAGNCGGGATPWGTWLSCEERERGMVWECDPFGKKPAVARPALGVFAHEAAAVDPATGQVYLTEDTPDGRLYRFTPTRKGDLSQGQLEGAFVKRGTFGVTWMPVADPLAREQPTRHQLSRSTYFSRGEGIVHHQGRIIFCTTADHRLWSFEIGSQILSILYDGEQHTPPPLTWPDTLAVAGNGTLLVTEDGGQHRIMARSPAGVFRPIVQLAGHPRSEPTGPALHPDGQRLFFSSQRGSAGRRDKGITYEISGPILG